MVRCRKKRHADQLKVRVSDVASPDNDSEFPDEKKASIEVEAFTPDEDLFFVPGSPASSVVVENDLPVSTALDPPPHSEKRVCKPPTYLSHYHVGNLD